MSTGAPEEFDTPLAGGFVTGAPDAFGESYLADLPAGEMLEIGTHGEADVRLAFRRTLGMFATGVTVITRLIEEQVHGMTANAFASVSLEPPLVLVSVDRRARMHKLLHEGARYGISVLSSGQELLSDHFAGRTGESAVEARFEVVHETPLVEGALAHLVAKVVRSYWGGDHSLFLGQVEYARYEEGRPLLFHGGRYERLLAHVPVFSALPPDVFERLIAAGAERTFDDGDAIVQAGEPGADLYVILEGAARVERAGRPVRQLGPHDLFGEIAVLDGGPRTADVVADGPCRCLAVPRLALREALEAEPGAAWQLLEVLARRFRGIL
jgi:flavin reductase (DIM6/NTAB) family NADH-FMN oxidoreductase RutF